jgi:hypothetical protein
MTAQARRFGGLQAASNGMTPKWQSCCAKQTEARLRQDAAVSECLGYANAYGFGEPTQKGGGEGLTI